MQTVFTDLDGTLLDHETYSWEAARPALERLELSGILWILVTRKRGPRSSCGGSNSVIGILS
jgi:mannosyl-3-phosphoglycerate phosphatase